MKHKAHALYFFEHKARKGLCFIFCKAKCFIRRQACFIYFCSAKICFILFVYPARFAFSAWGGALFLGILRILRILGIYRCAAIILRWFVFGLNTATVCVPYTRFGANKSVQYPRTANYSAKKRETLLRVSLFCFLRFADQRGSNGPGSEVRAMRSISLKP